ncbi:membrane protein insertion efficiency factor YidD [Actinophytocola sp.]|uniref:membrane protein insertion efficiency factor YidD n=1 Tax=Actinophytocola sp. TaxID=1872138 RepID=UPI0039C86177
MKGSGTVTPAGPGEAARPGPVARVLLLPVRFYRTWISPVLPPSCRFEPSCSAYAVEALTVHGALRGCLLTLRRLLRCGPWHPGGWDPVPPRREKVPTDAAAIEATTERAPAEVRAKPWRAQRTRNRPDESRSMNLARPSAAEE